MRETNPLRLHALRLDTRVGPLTLFSDGTALTFLLFGREASVLDLDLRGLGPDPVLRKAAQQLREFFAGKRHSFEVPLHAEGTPFQRAVWAALHSIPFGETISYGELARRVHRPTASRAVGGAVGKNPISILVPCHRVIGANGALTGYGGGLENKRRLLDFERAAPRPLD